MNDVIERRLCDERHMNMATRVEKLETTTADLKEINARLTVLIEQLSENTKQNSEGVQRLITAPSRWWDTLIAALIAGGAATIITMVVK